MDETIFEYPDTKVRSPLPIPDEGTEEREELSKNPRDMLSISMSRRERLPDDLHRAMILWSFHPDFHLLTKFYFDWVAAVEHKEENLFAKIKKGFFGWLRK